MKFSLKLVLLVVFIISGFQNLIFSQNLDFEWIKIHGAYSGVNPEVYVFDVQSDHNNNVIVLGSFSSTAIFDSDTLYSIDDRDIFLIKYNPVGEIQWIKHFGGNNYDSPTSIAINNNNDIYILGTFMEECYFDGFLLTTSNFREQFLVKINESGVTQWAKSFKSDSNSRKIIIDDYGNIYYAGWIDDYITFGDNTLSTDGYSDIFIAKLDQAGDFINGIVINGLGEQNLKDIKYHEGNLYLIGDFEYDIKFPGNTLNAKGKEDIFIAKYNTDLELQWANKVGGYYDDHGESIIIRENDLVISGSFTYICNFTETELLTSISSQDAFIASYDFSGNFNWANSIGSQAHIYNCRVSSDTSGLLYITGTSRGIIEKEGYSFEPLEFFKNDIYMARFGPNGNFHWLTGFNGIGYEYISGFRKNLDNSFMLIGNLEDGIYFTDTIAQRTTGNTDNIFVTVFNDTIYHNDIAVSYMSEPNSLIIYEANKQVTVKVANLGSKPQSNISLSFSVNDNTPVVDIIPALGPYETAYHTFSQTVDMMEIGEYIFKFEIELAGDESPANNSLTDTVNSITAPINSLHWGSIGDPLNGLTLSWTNAHVSDNQVDSIKWGYTEEYSEGIFVPGITDIWGRDMFSYQFPSLIGDTVIHYAVYNNYWNRWSEDNTYNTSVNVNSDKFSFSVTGNSQANTDDWKKVADRMNNDSDFGLFFGDIAFGYSEWGDVWEEWMMQGEHFTANNLIYHAFGDNDYDSGPETYDNILFLPESSSGNKRYYSFEYGNALFICLNSNNDYDEQHTWLDSTLEANSDKMWKFVYFHHLFYSCDSHKNELNFLFDSWWKTFDDHGVDMILNGQAPNYQRTKPINRNIELVNPVEEYGSNPDQGRCQINLGGAGATVEDVVLNRWFEKAEAALHFGKFEINENKLIFSAVDTSGQLIDSFVHIKFLPGEIIEYEDSVCLGSSTGNMSLVHYKGTNLKWQKRFNGGTWTDIDNTAESYEEIPESVGLWEYRTELIDFDSTIYSAPVQIHVLGDPVSGFSHVSYNLEARFTNLSENAVYYLWDFGDGNFSTEESPAHVYSAPDVFNVQLIAINNICFLNDTFASNIEVYLPKVVVDEDSVWMGSSTGNLSLVSYKGTITKWQKRLNGGTWTDIDNTEDTYEEIPESVGLWEYRTELIDFDSTLYSIPAQIYVLAEHVSSSSDISVSEAGKGIVTIFPNPTSGIIHIRLNEIQDDMFVRIYDLTGKLLIEKYYNRIQKTNLSLENLEKGSYILQLCTNDISISNLIIFN